MADINRDLDQLAINEARALSIDMVQEANSGHPGMPLGVMPAAFELWAHHLKFNPKDPKWPNRDRFVLSAGHGSALQYSLSYLFGQDYTLDDLKDFRQIHSKTPGHPDYMIERAVEVTTGPLGQGLSIAVGMALAEEHLAAKFNTEEEKIFDNYTYVIAGDGCMMEGITSEASSLAGHLGLDKLIVLYDSNDITIDGNTSLAFTENVKARYDAYNWHTQLVEDGSDLDAVSAAIEAAKANTTQPSFIEIRTTIGYGSPVAASHKSHGAALGDEGVRSTKEYLGLNPDEKFAVSDEVLEYCRGLKKDDQVANQEWQDTVEAYLARGDENSEALRKYLNKEWFDILDIEGIEDFEGNIATRITSQTVLNKISPVDPLLIGGSADLAGSNMTTLSDSKFISPDDYSGKNIHYGVREFAMGAIANGLTLSGLHSYCATFLAFSDYMRYDLRMAALMEIPTIFVMTHDSIGLGEDGQTHQPIEHMSTLRALPNLHVWRPADGRETVAAYASVKRDGPTLLALTRQKLPQLENSSAKEAIKGAYILEENAVENNQPELILMATGSEVSLAKEAYDELVSEGKSVRLVSMPSFEAFEEQTEEYRESVLPKAVTKRVAVEAANTMSWYKYLTADSEAVTIDVYGDSGKGDDLFEYFGFTKENVLDKCRSVLAK